MLDHDMNGGESIPRWVSAAFTSGCLRMPKGGRSKGRLEATKKHPLMDTVGFTTTTTIPPAMTPGLDPLTAMAAASADDEACMVEEEEDPEEGEGRLSEAEEIWRRLAAEAAAAATPGAGDSVAVPEPLRHLLSRLPDGPDPDDAVGHRQRRLDILTGHGGTATSTRLLASAAPAFADAVQAELAGLWKDDRRTGAVRIAVQVAKVAGSGSPAVFFPLADVLRHFGDLVYDRLVSKCPGLKINFTAGDADEDTSELCDNWLSKISSVRELVPRVMLEAALLRCRRFSEQEPPEAAARRLAAAARGVADPAAAAHVRAFVSASAVRALRGAASGVCRANYEDFLECYRLRFANGSAADRPLLQAMGPAVEWLLSAQLIGLAPSQRDRLMNRCLNEVDNAGHPGFLYSAIFKLSSPASIQGQIAHVFRLMAGSASDPAFPVARMAASLGEALLRSPGPAHPRSQRTLEDAWKLAATTEDLDDYLRCAAVWTEFASKHLGHEELNVLLGDIVGRIRATKAKTSSNRNGTNGHVNHPSRPPTFCGRAVPAILNAIDSHCSKTTSPAAMPNYLPLLEIVPAMVERVSAACGVLGRLVDAEAPRDVPFPTLLRLCQLAAGADAGPDLVLAALRQRLPGGRRGLGADGVSERLQLLCDARAALPGLPRVQAYLAHAANDLAAAGGRQVGRDARGACLAFALATAPALPPSGGTAALLVETAAAAAALGCPYLAEEAFAMAVDALEDASGGRHLSGLEGAACALLNLLPRLPESRELTCLEPAARTDPEEHHPLALRLLGLLRAWGRPALLAAALRGVLPGGACPCGLPDLALAAALSSLGARTGQADLVRGLLELRWSILKFSKPRSLECLAEALLERARAAAKGNDALTNKVAREATT